MAALQNKFALLRNGSTKGPLSNSKWSLALMLAVAAAVALVVGLAWRHGQQGDGGSVLGWAASLKCAPKQDALEDAWNITALPVHPCCAWNPYLLSMQKQRWTMDSASWGLPTLVGPWRRLLTAQIAAGVLEAGVPGDFVETGTWQGGMTILMLKALSDFDPNATRKMWAADSFQGLPESVAKDGGQGQKGDYAAPRADFDKNVENAAKSLPITQVENRLRVLQGWFNETLPTAPIEKVAFLRLDGDIYSSTMDALTSLYDKVSPGGVIYLDDYGSYRGCAVATNEFRAARNITCPLLRSALPETGLGAEGNKSNWESAWWVKPLC